MAFSREQVLGVIYEAVDEVNEQFSGAMQLEKSPATPLFGGSGPLDSLGFVNLVTLLEEKCEERLGVYISLAEQPSPDENVFATVESLADFILARLEKI